jgi:hypothetical protein
VVSAWSGRGCSLQQAGFDFGGDVGVGHLDPVTQDVPQAAGLRDLGGAVGGPGVVEGAVDRGGQGAATADGANQWEASDTPPR